MTKDEKATIIEGINEAITALILPEIRGIWNVIDLAVSEMRERRLKQGEDLKI